MKRLIASFAVFSLSACSGDPGLATSSEPQPRFAVSSAATSSTSFAYVTNSSNSVVSVIETSGNVVVATIPVGPVGSTANRTYQVPGFYDTDCAGLGLGAGQAPEELSDHDRRFY